MEKSVQFYQDVLGLEVLYGGSRLGTNDLPCLRRRCVLGSSQTKRIRAQQTCRRFMGRTILPHGRSRWLRTIIRAAKLAGDFLSVVRRRGTEPLSNNASHMTWKASLKVQGADPGWPDSDARHPYTRLAILVKEGLRALLAKITTPASLNSGASPSTSVTDAWPRIRSTSGGNASVSIVMATAGLARNAAGRAG